MLFDCSSPYWPESSEILPGFDGEGDGAGAGAGSGAGVTLEQVQTLVNDVVNKTVNNAIVNLKKTDFPKIIEASLGPVNTALSGITESLKGLTAGSQGGGGGTQNGQGSNGQGGQGQGGQSAIPPEVNSQLKQLGEQVKKQGDTISTLQADRDAANTRAEKAERGSVIKNALGEVQFASPSAFSTAFGIVDPLITKLDDGTFVGGDNLPIVDFIKDFLPKEHGYLLKSTGAQGSGAQGTGAAGGAAGRGSGKVDLNDIKPGMTQEKRAQAVAEIAAVLVASK